MKKSGIILIDKKENRSTVQEEVALKNHLDFRKVGHAGTLDPFASGLLIIGVNKGTKILSFFEEKDKSYIAVIQLGQKTITADRDGDIIQTQEPKKHTVKEVEEIIRSFQGDSEQVPPMYSALKKDGQPLYKLAREGQTIVREPRKIHIEEIKLLSYDAVKNQIEFQTEVTKGTYIRTLGEDIAAKLGEIGYLLSLRRIQVGSFKIEDAKESDKTSEDDVMTIAELFSSLKQVRVSEENEKRIRNGADIKLVGITDKTVLALDKNGEALGLYLQNDDDWYKPIKELF